MSSFTVPQFVEGDRVVYGDEKGTIVECRNHTTGQRFLMIWCHEGPRKNQRIYPKGGWKPLLDHGDGPGYRCAECSREFRRTVLGREIWCLTCVTAHDAEDRARETDVGVTHQFGMGARKARRE